MAKREYNILKMVKNIDFFFESRIIDSTILSMCLQGIYKSIVLELVTLCTGMQSKLISFINKILKRFFSMVIYFSFSCFKSAEVFLIFQMNTLKFLYISSINHAVKHCMELKLLFLFLFYK